MKSDILAQDLVSAFSRNLQIRIQTDYDTMIEISEDLAKDVIEDAKRFLVEVEKIIKKSKF